MNILYLYQPDDDELERMHHELSQSFDLFEAKQRSLLHFYSPVLSACLADIDTVALDVSTFCSFVCQAILYHLCSPPNQPAFVGVLLLRGSCCQPY